jgi:hypothetical protein
MNRFAILLTATAALALAVSPLAAQTDTTFTYQGTLAESGAPADGSFDLSFLLFDALSGGSQVGSTIDMNGVPVANGLLTVELDFEASAFDNTGRWLEIVVEGTTLSPRQAITRAPYSIQTRGIFVDDNKNVGIGTSTPNYALDVESGGPFAIYGRGTAVSGFSTGVSGQSQSTDGHGVFGAATATTGSTTGVWGQSSSTVGIGVLGNALAATGTGHGVRGSSQSTSGRGVSGFASASTGFTYGGYFESNSTSGRGVLGEATASTGGTYGVIGISNSQSGRGVYGIATASTGGTMGVRGNTESTSGTGVFGEASTSIGTTYGVRGKSLSTSGRGVFGHATASSGTTDGVFGQSDSTSGRGLDGWASASSGITFGVFGTSSSTSGAGVQGEANAASGTNYGVIGKSFSSSGFDFYAAGAGQNYGSSSSRRWKSNIEPISDPLVKLGQLRGVYYDWDEEHGGHHDLGMIAEEVGEVLPEIVNYEANGIDAIGMDYSKMTPLLVEAVNALRAEKDAEITMLRESHAAEMNNLRQQLSDLQQMVRLLASKQEMENAR